MCRTVERIFSVLSLVLLVACGQGETGANKDELVVGLLAPLTGVMAPHGASMQMGARVAVDELNEQGGIVGRNVRLVVLDTASDPGAASQRARELIDRDHADLLIGTGLSSETLAVIPIATRAAKPFIYSMDGELKTCAAGQPGKVAPLVWGAGFTERMIVPSFFSRLIAALPSGKNTKLFFLGGDYVYPRATNQFAESVAKQHGLAIVGNQYVDVATTDYTPVIRRIQASGANLLIVTNPGSAAATFMRQARQLGLDKTMAISGFATFAQEAVGELGDAGEGVLYANRYSDLLATPLNQRFVARFRRAYPNQPLLPGPTAAAGGYGVVMVAAAAYRKASGKVGADDFAAAMKGLTVDLPQGPVTVDPLNNIFQQHIYLLRVKAQRYRIVADLGLQTHPGLEGCSVR